jgi:hypothetical protein
VREWIGDLAGPDPADTSAFALLLVLIVAVPIPYGSVLPGGATLLEALAFLAAGAALLSRRPARPMGLAWGPLLAITGIALLGCFQLLPLPGTVLQMVSPTSARIYGETADILRLFEKPLRWSPRISIAPSETVDTVLLTLAYLAAFIAAALTLYSRSRRRVFAGVLLASGGGHVLLATMSQQGEDRMHGPFVNPNHFAGYLEIALALAFGLLVMVLSPREARHRKKVWRNPGDRFEKRVVPVAGAILLWGTIATGIGFSKSRGGILAALLATVLMALLSVLRGSDATRKRERALLAGGALFAGLVFVAMAAGREPLLRFLAADPREIGRDTRLEMWRLSVDAFRQFPAAGSGLGTFREAFRRVQPREFAGLVEQAHSEPLQLLVTGGGVGLALGTMGLLGGLWLLVRLFRRQPHREERVLALAALGALASLLLHGLAEFNFSIPAIPATLAALMGAGWAAGSWSEREEKENEMTPGATTRLL